MLTHYVNYTQSIDTFGLSKCSRKKTSQRQKRPKQLIQIPAKVNDAVTIILIKAKIAYH